MRKGDNMNEQTKRRRNRQPLEKILDIARAKVAAGLQGETEYNYYRGVVDTLDHVLGNREVFVVKAAKTVSYDIATN
jgi:hypothetical protein